MKQAPTDVIFLWHMHQPYYRKPNDDYYLLPWVRLHGVKDYYGMARTVEKFDNVKVTFNFSGILIEQIIDYAENKAKDYYGILTLKNPRYLTRAERDFIVERFFSVNFERFIRPNSRYLQLYHKKMSKASFSAQDILDLQVIFNLCWFHPYTVKEDKSLREIVRKGNKYNHSDKEYIMKKQYSIISKVIPLYRRLFADGRIELSLTPYAHPIMPLVYDTDVLKDFPYLKRPSLRFSHPEDCLWHLDKSQSIFRNAFGKKIRGSWPSEGSVSEEVASIYADRGFKWIGADEEILFKSLTTEFVPGDLIRKQRHLIYRPYLFRNLNIFFRDRNLSDALSFIYQGWDDPVFAANDFLEHCKRIHYYTKNILKKRAVVIIMDGENAWEYYNNNAVEFLETIYNALEHSNILSSNTPSQFLKNYSPKPLERLSPGSWINGDFGVWVGSKENNHNWYILRRIRDQIEKVKDKGKRNKLLEHFYIIEGSDWNWWNTFEEATGDFNNLFFSYIHYIYKILGKKIPSYIINR